jgi:hypothetical protein
MACRALLRLREETRAVRAQGICETVFGILFRATDAAGRTAALSARTMEREELKKKAEKQAA